MDFKGPDRRPFRFTDPRQERIYRRLALIGPGPAAFYQNACQLMASEVSLTATTHLVAHLLRDIESALRDVLLPQSFMAPEKCASCGSRRDYHKKQIEAILSTYGFEDSDDTSSLWHNLASDFARFAHRDALSSPRPVDRAFSEFWEKALTVFDELLDRFESNYLEFLPVLDDLLAKRTPTQADVQILRLRMPNNDIVLGYFFGRLTNREWLKPLNKGGLFKNPRAPEYDYENDRVAFPSWPQSYYLMQMASIVPDTVLGIILDIPETDNVHTHEDFAEAACAMCKAGRSDLAAQWAYREAQWINRQDHLYMLLPESLGNLVSHLSKGGEPQAALTLARSLLAVLPGYRLPSESDDDLQRLPSEPRARFDTWDYQQILEKNIPDLVAAAGLETFAMLSDLLESAVDLSSRGGRKQAPEDYSYIWQPAVEAHEQNQVSGLRSMLVFAVRDAAERLCKQNPGVVSRVVATLEDRPWLIFHRLALHLVRVSRNAALELVAPRLVDRQRFDDLSVRHEYYLLMRDCFALLDTEHQEEILGWIDAGPDVPAFRARFKRDTGEEPGEDVVALHTKHWQRDRLSAVASQLTAEWKERYDTLVKEVGAAEHPDFVSWSSGIRTGPTSPKAVGDLRLMSVADLVSFLREWQPSGDTFEPSMEGLGRQIQTLVASEPDRFAAEAMQFAGLDPTYVRSVIAGLGDAVAEKRAFDWAPVLDLCHWAVGQPREMPGLDQWDNDRDPGWGWTRKAIASLLGAGFEQKEGQIPFAHRNDAWSVLLPLTSDPDPTTEDEVQHGMDPATLSINTVRGEAMHSAVRYALWVRRHIGKETDGEERLKRGFDEMPEVREVLDYHLEPAQEPSLAIHAVYGQWFPWLNLLDPVWAAGNLARIFPREEKLQGFRDAAWAAYIVFCQPYNDALSVLREEYARAIKEMGRLSDTMRGALSTPDERLAHHLMTFYGRGKLGLGDPEGLIAQLYANAPDKIRGIAISFIGRGLCNAEGPVETEVLERFRVLWESRAESARNSDSPAAYSEELKAFGSWFASGKFDDAWAIGQLREALDLVGQTEPDHMVVKRLADVAPQMPLDAVECLRRMVEGDKEGWHVRSWRKEATAILSAGLESSDSKTRDTAEDLIHRLGARGHLYYRDLLK